VIELLLAAENALALGLLDRAERTYRTVLEADPRNGIAAVGLSRVALERGDDAGARALALAALQIDPENATARRMVDRLDEVARYRDMAASALPAAPAYPAVSAPPPEMEPPPAAANQAAPARPGLLRRILRRS
jgi:tetratricopeptide (TPR) repeat protein